MCVCGLRFSPFRDHIPTDTVVREQICNLEFAVKHKPFQLEGGFRVPLDRCCGLFSVRVKRASLCLLGYAVFCWFFCFSDRSGVADALALLQRILQAERWFLACGWFLVAELEVAEVPQTEQPKTFINFSL